MRILKVWFSYMSRKQRMHDALNLKLKPDFLSVDNESSNHQVPEHAETHFKIIAVSTQFNGLNRVARHRLINSCIAQEFNTGLHALSLHTYTPDEWRSKSEVIASPQCQHKKPVH